MIKIEGYNTTGRRISTQQLLEKIYDALAEGENEFEINASGQHDLGGPLWSREGKELYFKLKNPGQRCGSMAMKGTTIDIEGSTSADLGWLNAGAKIICRGDGGDTTGHCAAGGKIYIGGRVGTRSGALMKRDPSNEPPQMWILKNTGSFPFEFMGGGIAVVCGLDYQGASVLGSRACTGMVGGTVYFRGPIEGYSEADVTIKDLTDEDKEFLSSGFDDFLKSIDKIDKKKTLTVWSQWKKVVPRSYEEKQLMGHDLSIRRFRMEKWVKGGIFSDVLKDEGEVISLVNKDKYRLHIPKWENSKFMSPCQFQCPSYIPTQKRTRLLREGKYKEAVDLILQYSPFPGSICGSVCPNLCMKDCTRGDFDEPISIKELGRASIGTELPEAAPSNGKKVAVIGGGAGGISAAWQLRLRGYQVEIFEKEKKLGGKMSYAIPRDRLSGLILDKELDLVMSAKEITVHLESDIKKADYVQLKRDFDAVIIAAGAHDPKVIPVPGHERIVKGLDFLKAVHHGEKPQVGKKVVVIGAGNAGMDVSWEAFNHGAVEVTNIDVQKPMAFEEEIEKVASRGGKVLWPAYTEEVTEYGVKLKDGTLLEADTVIISIGEVPEMEFLTKEQKTPRGLVKVDQNYKVEAEENVFAIGDTLIPGLLTDAVGSGFQVAHSLDAHFSGAAFITPPKIKIDKERIHTEYYRAYRKKTTAEADFDPTLESKVCLSCGTCRDCHMCEEACPEGAISRIETEDGQYEYVSDSKKCIGCGLCSGVCPCGIWQLYPNKEALHEAQASPIGD